jgi:hypothetical protein
MLGAPLPKFAKALIKLARANPKKILSKKNPKKISSKKEVGTKRVAKNDSEVLEMKTKRSRKEFMKDVKIKTRAKDDSELLKLKSAAEKLQKIEVTKLKGKQLNKCVDDIKIFFEDAINLLDENNHVIKPIKSIIRAMNIFDENIDIEEMQVPSDIANKIVDNVKQIQAVPKIGG